MAPNSENRRTNGKNISSDARPIQFWMGSRYLIVIDPLYLSNICGSQLALSDKHPKEKVKLLEETFFPYGADLIGWLELPQPGIYEVGPNNIINCDSKEKTIEGLQACFETDSGLVLFACSEHFGQLTSIFDYNSLVDGSGVDSPFNLNHVESVSQRLGGDFFGIISTHMLGDRLSGGPFGVHQSSFLQVNSD
jgi:hypothetical protein